MFSLDTLFMVTAVGGGALFLVQLLLQFLGGSMGADVDLDLDGASHGHVAADAGFKVLSLQGLTAFFMMVGLVGWALRRDSHASATLSLVAALAAGLSSSWIIGRIFHYFARMQSSGTLDMRKAQGAQGTVYLGIAADKPGKVSITVGTRLLTLDAVTMEGGEPLSTGTPIRVVRVIDDNTVMVEKH